MGAGGRNGTADGVGGATQMPFSGSNWQYSLQFLIHCCLMQELMLHSGRFSHPGQGGELLRDSNVPRVIASFSSPDWGLSIERTARFVGSFK